MPGARIICHYQALSIIMSQFGNVCLFVTSNSVFYGKSGYSEGIRFHQPIISIHPDFIEVSRACIDHLAVVDHMVSCVSRVLIVDTPRCLTMLLSPGEQIYIPLSEILHRT